MDVEFPLETDQEIEVDPVCGKTVPLDEAKERGLAMEFEGRAYVFCGAACRSRFTRAPTRYAVSGRAQP
jgi:YHS domain-containing protein